MSSQLSVSIGQYTDKGRKKVNQDYYGFSVPKEPLISTKGIALAMADGISSSDVSQEASQAAVTGFLADYFCTSEAWSVKKSARRVLIALNSWLYAQTRRSQFRYEKDRGYVCTFSALIIKSTSVHIFHVGDTRIYRLSDSGLEQLTNDHRVWISKEQNYLSRALGIGPQLEIDYQTLVTEEDDFFIFMTDGVYEFASEAFIIKTIEDHKSDLSSAAKLIIDEAYNRGSDDNLTIQIVKIDQLPLQDSHAIYRQLTELPLPPILQARMNFDGFTIIRQLHASHRSHVYLAVDNESEKRLVLKTPSIDLQNDSVYLERFLLEDWIARRIDNPHVLKPCALNRKQNFIYLVTEFIEGQTLAQWMVDNPKPDLIMVRGIVEQIAKGLQAFHRLEMLHQDIRPQNIMIDVNGTIKIIDFGSTRVAGLTELSVVSNQNHILGTAAYTAPEYFLGEQGSTRSDLFSLGIIAYQLLTGKLPYGTQVARTKTKAEQSRLTYRALIEDEREIPDWINFALRKAIHPNPYMRYSELSEFIYDLNHPNQAFLTQTKPPLIESNPVAFWKGLSFILMFIIFIQNLL